MQNPVIRFSNEIHEITEMDSTPQKVLHSGIAYLKFSASVAVMSQIRYLAPVQIWNGINKVRILTAVR